MARITASLAGKLAQPILEIYKLAKTTTTAVGTTAISIPATPASYRKALVIQNIDATKTVYLGGNAPEIVIRKNQTDPTAGTLKPVDWVYAAAGTNEWYAVAVGGGDPGLTQPTALYYTAIGGTETLGTSGTKAMLDAEHKWAWGTEPVGAAFSTIFIRTNGATLEAYSPKSRYESILTYSGLPDNSSSYGYALGPNREMLAISLDSTSRIFAIASGASANVITLEFV